MSLMSKTWNMPEGAYLPKCKEGSSDINSAQMCMPIEEGGTIFGREDCKIGYHLEGGFCVPNTITKVIIPNTITKKVIIGIVTLVVIYTVLKYFKVI